MAFTGEQLKDTVDAMASHSGKYVELRTATRGKTVTLTPSMAALIGKGQRKLIPFLGLAVEAVANKLFVKSVAAERASLTKQLDAWLKANSWERIERKLYDAVARDGKAFILTTWNGGPRYHLKEAFDGVSGVHLFTSSVTGEPTHAVNTWLVDKDRYLDVYFPDRIEKYILHDDQWSARRDVPAEEWPVSWTDIEGKPLGIAITQYGDGESLIGSALQIQEDLNAALLDLQAVSRTQGWPQRFITGSSKVEFIVGPNGQPVRSAAGNPIRREFRPDPGSILPLGDGSDLKQLDAAPVDVSYVRELISLLSLQTGVPSHVFTGDWPSGIALQTSETRLNTKVEDLQGALNPSIVAMLQLSVRMSATFGGPSYDPTHITEVIWYPPEIETEEIIQERDKATTALYEKGLMSRRQALKRIHPEWSDKEVDEELLAIANDRSTVAPIASPADLTGA